jgi:hypothetical protein
VLPDVLSPAPMISDTVEVRERPTACLSIGPPFDMCDCSENAFAWGRSVTFAAAQKTPERSRDREGAVDIARDRSLSFAVAQKMRMLISRHLCAESPLVRETLFVTDCNDICH